MMGYDALEPYMKRGDDMVLESEIKTLEGMPERMVMQVKKIQGEAQDIIEGVQS